MSGFRKVTKVFRALSEETRVRVMQLPKGRALDVKALAARLKVTPAAPLHAPGLLSIWARPFGVSATSRLRRPVTSSV